MKNRKLQFISLLCFFLLSSSISAQDLFMAVTKSGNNGYILKSTDFGKTLTTVWDSEMQAQTGQNRLFDICEGNGKLVAVGNTILTSEDQGKSWKENNLYRVTGEMAFPNRDAIKCVTYGNGFYVAAAKFHIIYSQDGLNWKFVRTGKLSTAEKNAEKKPSGFSLSSIKKDPKNHGKRPSEGEFPPEITPGIQYPLDIIFAKDRFYLVGGNRSMQGQVLKIEGDKIVVEKELPFTGNAATLNTGGLKTIKWDGKNTLVACSNSTKTVYSTDMGATWNYIYNPEKNQIWGLAYNNGTWVSVSPFEDVFVSNDITTQWTKSFKRGGGRLPIHNMIYAYNRYIMVGNNGGVISTTDLENWDSNTSNLKYGYHIHGITAFKGNNTSSGIDSKKWMKYEFDNARISTKYSAVVFTNGSTSEKKTADNEVQIVSSQGSEKLIISSRKMSSGTYNSKEKHIKSVVDTYKKSASGSVTEQTATYNNLEGTKVAYKTEKGTQMITFNAVSKNNQLIIIACINMSGQDAETVFNNFNLQ